ncbi:MAG: hypothetical protein ACTHZ1_02170 [Sphingobacterium sp.]
MIRGTIVAWLIMLSCLEVRAQTLDLNAVRNDFNKGVKNEALCKRHLLLLNEQANSPLEKAYAAAFHMFMAKHTGNPFKKMNYFKEGRDRLEQQLNANPNNVELRFIRLSIQYHIPKYLGYHDDIEADKDYVMNHLYKLPDEFTKEIIYKYLAGANMYTARELALLGR